MNKKKILIIDDDEEICAELSEILTDENYDVKYESDGVKGLKRLNTENFDLVIQDLKLPSISGSDLLKSIKKINNNQKIIILTGRPINSLILSSDESFSNEEKVIFELADEVINKPVEVTDLLIKIKKII